MTRLRSVWIAVLGTVLSLSAAFAEQSVEEEPAPGNDAARKAERTKTVFALPCDGYGKGLRGKGNFGAYISRRADPAFAGSHHLAEDVWLPGGTPVKSVAAGKVVYSDFSPTWTDGQGRKHWNLGNVIVIEHQLEPPEGDLKFVCSFYVHLSKERLVKAGDTVGRGQPIGTIGKDRSEENGQYPAHLHFGIHKGPYYQIPPAWKRELEKEARQTGLPVHKRLIVKGARPETPPEMPKLEMVKGEISGLKRMGQTMVEVHFKGKDQVSHISLLVESTSPGYKPAAIMAWCRGYGDRKAVQDWLCPSRWIAAHGASAGSGK